MFIRALMLLLLWAVPALADDAGEALALYQRFAAAQNARDLAQVRPLFAGQPPVPLGQRRAVVLGP